MLTIVMDVKTMTQSVPHNSNFEQNSDTLLAILKKSEFEITIVIS